MTTQTQGIIDPTDPRYLGVPVWCVHGYPSQPHFLCCMLRPVGAQGIINIYGYTEPQPGRGRFNAIDQPVVEWRKKQQMCVFFGLQADALAFLGRLTTPKGKF